MACPVQPGTSCYCHQERKRSSNHTIPVHDDALELCSDFNWYVSPTDSRIRLGRGLNSRSGLLLGSKVGISSPGHPPPRGGLASLGFFVCLHSPLRQSNELQSCEGMKARSLQSSELSELGGFEASIVTCVNRAFLGVIPQASWSRFAQAFACSYTFFCLLLPPSAG
jgi:hypothetical protein